MAYDHGAFRVSNLEKAKDFFIKYFNATANSGYFNKTINFQSYFLSFSNGARIEIMKRPGIEENNKALIHAGYIHIAFSLGSKEKVDELTNRLKDDGYNVISGPRTTGDGYYESCIVGIEENQIELTI